MFQDKMVLCASSAYEKKFYLNENFDGLPQHVKDELKIMCVLFTEDVGGVLGEVPALYLVAESADFDPADAAGEAGII